MSHWVRLWDDMPNDPKWRVTARHAQCPVSQVLAVFNHMLINASASDVPGTLSNWNDEVVAIAIDAQTEDVTAIRRAMNGLVLDGERLRGWEKRQPKREDSSSSRTAEWRERKRSERDATKRTVTRGDARVESEADLDKIIKDKSRVESARAGARPDATRKNKSPISGNETPSAEQIADAVK